MSETTGGERIAAAIKLEKIDRGPVSPLAMYFCAHANGVSTATFLQDMELQTKLTEKTFDDMGGRDAWYFVPGSLNAKTLRLGWPLEVKVPGEDLPADAPLPQLNEKEAMTVEDYDALIAEGYDTWFPRYLQRLYPHLDAATLFGKTSTNRANLQTFVRKWQSERDVPLLQGVALFHPAEILSFARGFYQFSLDMRRRPEKVLQAIESIGEPVLVRAIKACKALGIDSAWVGGWRTGATFISDKQLETFCMPVYKKYVEALVSEGITPLLHFDANWTPFLRYLLEFPAKKCIFAPDQMTDLFEAKKILGDHMCLFGNVSPQVLALGTVDETVAECRELIDVVGKGGGFILGSGREVPYNARPENVRAMVETAKSYGVYR